MNNARVQIILQAVDRSRAVLEAVKRNLLGIVDAAGRANEAFGKGGGVRSINAIGGALRQLSSIAEQVLGMIIRLFTSMGRAILEIAGDITRTFGDALQDLLGIATRVSAGILAALAAAFAVTAKRGIDMNTALSQADAAMTKIGGSAAVARTFVDLLQKEALSSIPTFKELLPIGTQLAAAYGPNNLGKVIPTIRAFGDAASLLVNGDPDAMRRSLLGFRQILDRNRIHQEEINQMTEALPGLGIPNILRKAFGTADTEALQRARVSGRRVADAIVAGIQERFGGAQVERMLFLPGLLSTASDLLDRLTGQMTQGLLGALEGAGGALKVFNDQLTRIADTPSLVEALAVPFDLVGKGIQAAADALPGFVDWLTAVLTKDNVIKFLADLWGNVRSLGDEFMKMVNAVSGGKTLGDIFTTFQGMAVKALDTVLRLWNALVAGVRYFAEHGDELWQAIIDGVNLLIAAFQTLVGVATILFAIIAVEKIVTIGTAIGGLVLGVLKLGSALWDAAKAAFGLNKNMPGGATPGAATPGPGGAPPGTPALGAGAPAAAGGGAMAGGGMAAGNGTASAAFFGSTAGQVVGGGILAAPAVMAGFGYYATEQENMRRYAAMEAGANTPEMAPIVNRIAALRAALARDPGNARLRSQLNAAQETKRRILASSMRANGIQGRSAGAPSGGPAAAAGASGMGGGVGGGGIPNVGGWVQQLGANVIGWGGGQAQNLLGQVPASIRNFAGGLMGAMQEGYNTGGYDQFSARANRYSRDAQARMQRALAGGRVTPGGANTPPGHAMGGLPIGGGSDEEPLTEEERSKMLKEAIDNQNAYFGALKERAEWIARSAGEGEVALERMNQMMPVLQAQLEHQTIPLLKRHVQGTKAHNEALRSYFDIMGQMGQLRLDAAEEESREIEKAEREAKKAADAVRKARVEHLEGFELRAKLAEAQIENEGGPNVARDMVRRNLIPLLLERFLELQKSFVGETSNERLERLLEAEKVQNDILEAEGVGKKQRKFAKTLGGGMMPLFDMGRMNRINSWLDEQKGENFGAPFEVPMGGFGTGGTQVQVDPNRGVKTVNIPIQIQLSEGAGMEEIINAVVANLSGRAAQFLPGR